MVHLAPPVKRQCQTAFRCEPRYTKVRPRSSSISGGMPVDVEALRAHDRSPRDVAVEIADRAPTPRLAAPGAARRGRHTRIAASSGSQSSTLRAIGPHGRTSAPAARCRGSGRARASASPSTCRTSPTGSAASPRCPCPSRPASSVRRAPPPSRRSSRPPSARAPTGCRPGRSLPARGGLPCACTRWPRSTIPCAGKRAQASQSRTGTSSSRGLEAVSGLPATA